MRPLLSFLIVDSPLLEAAYLPLQIEALNRQQSQDFNVFWIHQGPDPEPLRRLLQAQARFGWQLLHAGADYPLVAGVICWELLRPFAAALHAPEIAPYFSYLHKECLPAPDFVASLARLLPELAGRYGQDFVAACHQLRSPLTRRALSGDFMPQLAAAGGHVWKARLPYDRATIPAIAEQPWAEDAFVMPSALARELALFTAPRSRLWFLDLFNILPPLAQRPWARQIRWLRLRDPVIYHLAHPRAFREYSRDFLAAVRQRPDLFGHLGLYDIAFQGQAYDEPFIAGKRLVDLGRLGLFYGAAVRSQRGSASLWALELDAWHHRNDPELPELRLAPGGLEASSQALPGPLDPALAEALAIWAGESPADYPAALAHLYEAEGRRLWLRLQQALAGRCRVSYTSALHGKSYAHWREYPQESRS